MQVAKNKVVSINYNLTDDEGTLIDSSEGYDPLAYLHGVGNIVAGLEKALEGKNVGDEFKVSLTPSEAYGDRNDELCSVVPKDMFESADDIEVGMHFSIPDEESGEEQFVMVTEITEDDVTVDANHPLAGVNLVFDVSVVEVRDATDEEIEHGHAHGVGGHSHDDEA